MRDGRREPSLHAARCLDPRPLLHAARRAPPRLAPALCRPRHAALHSTRTRSLPRAKRCAPPRLAPAPCRARHAALCSTRCGRDSAGRCIAAGSCAAPAPCLGGRLPSAASTAPAEWLPFERREQARCAARGPGWRWESSFHRPRRATYVASTIPVHSPRPCTTGGWANMVDRCGVPTLARDRAGLTGARSLSNDNAPLTVDRPASSTRRIQLDVFEDDCGALRCACAAWGSALMGQRQVPGESGG